MRKAQPKFASRKICYIPLKAILTLQELCITKNNPLTIRNVK